MDSPSPASHPEPRFDAAVAGFLAGDFSRLSPLFETGSDGSPSPVDRWVAEGRFRDKPAALAEAFTAAAFNGHLAFVDSRLRAGADPLGGAATGLNAFHWAANRGQLEVVRRLLLQGAPTEVRNSYGGTVLGCAVWSAVHEPKPDHIAIVGELLGAGADVSEARFPSGDPRIDVLLERHRIRGATRGSRPLA